MPILAPSARTRCWYPGELMAEHAPSRQGSLRQPGFAQAVEKALTVGRTPERSCQPFVLSSQPGYQVNESVETGARVGHLPKVRRGRSKHAMRIRKCRIAVDRPLRAVRRLLVLLRAQISPGAPHKPHNHQEVAGAEAHRLVQVLNGGIAVPAKCVSGAQVSARERRVRIEFDCPQKTPDCVVVLAGEQLMNAKRGVGRGVLIIG